MECRSLGPSLQNWDPQVPSQAIRFSSPVNNRGQTTAEPLLENNTLRAPLDIGQTTAARLPSHDELETEHRLQGTEQIAAALDLQ